VGTKKSLGGWGTARHAVPRASNPAGGVSERRGLIEPQKKTCTRHITGGKKIEKRRHFGYQEKAGHRSAVLRGGGNEKLPGKD